MKYFVYFCWELSWEPDTSSIIELSTVVQRAKVMLGYATNDWTEIRFLFSLQSKKDGNVMYSPDASAFYRPEY